MESLDNIIKEISDFPGIISTAVTGDFGTFTSGIGEEDADEFAELLTYVGRSGTEIGDLLGADRLRNITLRGKKIRLIVHHFNDFFLGVRLDDTADVSNLESMISQSLAKLNPKD